MAEAVGTGRDRGSFRDPSQTSILPNVGRAPTSLRTALVGGSKEFSLCWSILAAPYRTQRPYMDYFVEGVPEWNRLGIGTGMNPTRTRSQFPFYKMPNVGEDSEYLNHNCKQKWRKGAWSAYDSIPPFLNWLRSPIPSIL